MGGQLVLPPLTSRLSIAPYTLNPGNHRPSRGRVGRPRKQPLPHVGTALPQPGSFLVLSGASPWTTFRGSVANVQRSSMYAAGRWDARGAKSLHRRRRLYFARAPSRAAPAPPRRKKSRARAAGEGQTLEDRTPLGVVSSRVGFVFLGLFPWPGPPGRCFSGVLAVSGVLVPGSWVLGPGAGRCFPRRLWALPGTLRNRLLVCFPLVWPLFSRNGIVFVVL